MVIHQWTAVIITCMMTVTIFMDWVATPLNRNIKKMSVAERLPSTLIHGSIGAAFALVNLFAVKWAVFIGAVWFTAVSATAIVNWWIPYFFNIHRGEITPEVYNEQYADNVTVLPTINNHPVIPDVQHMLIHLAVFASATLSWLSFVHV